MLRIYRIWLWGLWIYNCPGLEFCDLWNLRHFRLYVQDFGLMIAGFRVKDWGFKTSLMLLGLWQKVFTFRLQEFRYLGFSGLGLWDLG